MNTRNNLSSASRAATMGLLAAIVLLGVSCRANTPSGQAATDEVPVRGGTLVLGAFTDMDSWNEYLSTQSTANYVLRRVFLRLARGRDGGEEGPESFEPMLAESWEWSDDGLSVTFRLREAMWSDGRPITADDVRFTWLAQTSDHVPWINGEVKERITDVVVEDELTVTFRFDRRYAYQFSDAVEGGILPRHVYDAVPFEEWVTHDWSQYRIGSGPFLLERHTVGHEIMLRRNPLYFDSEHPLVDRIAVRIVPDVVSLVTQLRSGEIDILVDVPPREAVHLASDGRLPVAVVPFDLPRYEYLGWNCRRPPFDDPLLRRAITLALDRQALVEELLYDFGEVSSRPVPSDWWGAVDELEPWPYDPEEARAILARKGFSTVAADGTPGASGRVLEFELITNSGNRLRSDALIKIQAQLERIGVKVNVGSLEQGALIQLVSSGEFDGYLGGWNFIGKVPLDALFGSDYMPPRGFNVVGYHVADVDASLEELERAADWREMLSPLASIQQRIHQDQPYTFLFERDGIAAYGSRLRDVRIEQPADPLASLEKIWITAR